MDNALNLFCPDCLDIGIVPSVFDALPEKGLALGDEEGTSDSRTKPIVLTTKDTIIDPPFHPSHVGHIPKKAIF